MLRTASAIRAQRHRVGIGMIAIIPPPLHDVVTAYHARLNSAPLVERVKLGNISPDIRRTESQCPD